MKHLVEFLLEDGNSVLVEVDDSETGSVVRSGRPTETITKAQKTFEEAIEKVKPAASAIITKIRSLHDSPDEIEVEFGLKMSADAGAFVASTGIEANYKITLKWKKEEKPK